jgi:HEAT repeat protein
MAPGNGTGGNPTRDSMSRYDERTGAVGTGVVAAIAAVLVGLVFASVLVRRAVAEVDSSTFAKASARFEKGIESEDPEEREAAILEFARVTDERTVKALFSELHSQLHRVEQYETECARRQQELTRFQEIAAKSRTSRRPSSYLTEERRRLQTAVRDAVDRRDEAEATRAALAAGVAEVLRRLEGEEREDGIDHVVRRGIRADEASHRIAAVDVLAAAAFPASRPILEESLRGDPEIPVRVHAAEGLARLPRSEPPDALLGALTDSAWQVRVAAIGALVEIRSPASVVPLIEALEREDGRVQEDLRNALRALTGEDFHYSTALWRRWWADGGRIVEPAPPKETAEKGSEGAVAGEGRSRKVESGPSAASTVRYAASFYGIPTKSRSILFILDVSGSMNEAAGNDGETKISRAKEELLASLANLTPPARFNIIFFGDTVRTWQPRMVDLSAKSLARARDFIEETYAEGGTNIFGALRDGYDLAGLGSRTTRLGNGPDTIFLLSDGKPTRGEFTDPESIQREVRRWNEVFRIRIHTIGLGKQHNEKLMKGLAEESGGTYVRR